MMVVVVYDLGGCLVLHLLVDGTSIFNWSPEITGVACALLFHHIKGLIKSLFLGEEHLVDVYD